MHLTKSITRRNFLKRLIALSLLPLASFDGLASEETLSLYISRKGSEQNICFAQDGRLVQDGYEQICYLLKDHQSDSAVLMDTKLLIIMARAQKWLASYGYTEPFIITSAYRTFETNSYTEGASRNSMHMYGKAVDLKYPGLSSRYLAVLFRTFGATGIGVYPSFVHIDTWKERVWIG